MKGFSDFIAREKATRKIADVGDMNTDQLVAHVILASGKDDELLVSDEKKASGEAGKANKVSGFLSICGFGLFSGLNFFASILVIIF